LRSQVKIKVEVKIIRVSPLFFSFLKIFISRIDFDKKLIYYFLAVKLNIRET
jgi:hypothetical protein